MPSDPRGFSMRVAPEKAITKFDFCLLKVSLRLITSFSSCDTHMLHVLNAFCVWTPTPLHIDAGLRCLTASEKLWCACLILGFHAFVFIYHFKVKEESWGAWFSGSSPHQWRPDWWCVEDEWSVLDGGLKSPDSQSRIPEKTVLPDEWSLLRREVKRSMSLLSFGSVYMYSCVLLFNLTPDTTAILSFKCFIKLEFFVQVLSFTGNILQQMCAGKVFWWFGKEEPVLISLLDFSQNDVISKVLLKLPLREM